MANADGVTIYYNFTNDKTELAVTYQGSSTSSKAYADKVVIPESVTYEGKIYSVTAIGTQAFYGCFSMTELTIPNSVTSIGTWAFLYCSGLKKITVESGNPIFDSRENCNAIINTKSNELITGCKNTIIPNSVTSIGSYAFYECSGLTSMHIPNSVTFINVYAFSGCRGLTEVTIPGSVTFIAVSAFSGCRGLKEVTIPSSVTHIDTNPFESCSGLEKITVESGNPNYDSRENCNAIINTKSNELVSGCKNTIIPSSVTSISNSAFWGCSGLTEVTIPNNVTSIGRNPFESCYGLEKITVESGNPNYDSRENCNAIIETNSNELIAGCKNTIIPGSVTSIGYSAFSYCSGLTEVTIPNSVTSIGNQAFYNCSGLTEVTIPNSVTSIGSYAFDGCSGLTTLYSLNTTPPSVLASTFNTNHYTNVNVFVPEEALAAYQNAEVWKNFQKLQAVSTGVEHISTNDEQIQSANGQVTVTGLTDGTTVAVYDLSGQQVGTATSKGGQVNISTGLTAGAAAIVKIGERSVKTVMK